MCCPIGAQVHFPLHLLFLCNLWQYILASLYSLRSWAYLGHTGGTDLMAIYIVMPLPWCHAMHQWGIQNPGYTFHLRRHTSMSYAYHQLITFYSGVLFHFVTIQFLFHFVTIQYPQPCAHLLSSIYFQDMSYYLAHAVLELTL